MYSIYKYSKVNYFENTMKFFCDKDKQFFINTKEFFKKV